MRKSQCFHSHFEDIRMFQGFEPEHATWKRSGAGCALSALMFRGVNSRTFQVHLIGLPQRRDSCGPFSNKPTEGFLTLGTGSSGVVAAGPENRTETSNRATNQRVFKRAHGTQNNWAVTGQPGIPGVCVSVSVNSLPPCLSGVTSDQRL